MKTFYMAATSSRYFDNFFFSGKGTNSTMPSITSSSTSTTYYTFHFGSSLIPDITIDSVWLGMIIWSILELVFYLFINRIIHPRLDILRPAPENPLPPKECLSRLIDTLERLKGVYTPQRFWSGWFKGAAYEDIKRDNIKAFLSWAAWHLHPHELDEQDQQTLEDTVVALEVIQGKAFPEGYNDAVEHVAFTREPLSFSHRFLGFYVFVKCFQMIGGIFLRTLGHKKYRTANGLIYWHRKDQQNGPLKQAPLVFFHGISPGLWFYIPFLSKLGGGREVVLLEVPHIVTQLVFDAPDIDEIRDALSEIFARHHIKTCTVAGHSFGSIVAGWAASALPHIVQQLVLIDPVCLLLCLPDVAVNFLYRRPSANLMQRSLKDMIDPSSEITVSHALRRHFWWYQNVLWLQDVQCHIVVALSSEDDIVPSEAIYAYVRRHYGLETPRCPSSSSNGSSSLLRESLNLSKSRRPTSSSSFCSSSSMKRVGSGSSLATSSSNHRKLAMVGSKGALPDAKVLFWKGLGHGAMLASRAAQDELIQAMNTQAKEQGLMRWSGRSSSSSELSPATSPLDRKVLSSNNLAAAGF